MPKKLTVIGVLAALALGAFGLFNSSGQAAQIQPFSAATVNWTACYDGSPPSGGVLACGAGSSATTAPAATNLVSYTIIDLPAGQRLTLPITFTPTTWSTATVACAAGANNDCTAGTTTGNVTARTDILCDAGSPDILSDNTAPGGAWPDPSWSGFDFVRTAQDASIPTGGAGAPTGSSPNAYVTQIVPFPASFTFRSLDTATLTTLFLGGTLPLAITPVPLQLAAYRSAGGTYDASVALLGGAPGNPPTNDYLCLDSPQDSIAEVSYLQTPATAGLYPRWTIFTGDIDERDSKVIDRIVDLGCVNVGGFAADDDDGDCLQDAASGGTDANDTNPDQDGDGLPDGVEAAIGFPVNAADTDGDGANDYTEMFQFTSPTTADTDGDGSADRPDNGADENSPTSPTTIDDTTADDNCPADANPGQENNDSGNDFRLLPTAGNLDTTNNRQDTQGDACDTDDDNDGIVDVAEPAVLIAGAAPFCVASGGAAPNGGPLSSLDSDHDNDLGLDGRECQQNTRPDCSGTSGTYACASVAIARLGTGGASDPDNDQLFAPGVGTANATAETFYRTQNIRVSTGNAEDLADGASDGHADNPDGDASATGEQDNDSDNDGLLDGIEVRYYGTHPANPDTDADGCRDGREAGDVDGNRSVGAADLAAIANGTLPVFGNYRGADGQVDNNRKNYDLDRNGAIGGADLGIAANPLAFGSCGTPSNQQGPSINNQTRNP